MFRDEIKPYKKYVELFLKGQGVPNHDILRKIADVYTKHVRDKAFKDPVCIGCVNEVKHMMNQLSGAIDRDGQQPIALSPKIPKLKPKKKQDPKEPKIDVKSMKWGELKTYCKEQGINTKGKKKVELLKELGIS